jgi:glycosyltransferase involved in cell wall biosynthesis
MVGRRRTVASAAVERVAIVANGFLDGPAQALRDYLVGRGGEVITIFHPLTAEQGKRHELTTYANGSIVSRRSLTLPLRPPASFALDPLVPLLPAKVDTWFGFNPLAGARGLVARSTGRAARVVLWSVDFVPDRFGRGTLPTRVYDRLDRMCCRRADARVELSEAARVARNDRHGLLGDEAPAFVVPMGAWLYRVPTTSPDNIAHRRIVFLGHLVERQGVDTLLQALTLCDDVSADVIGTGPLEADFRAETTGRGLDERVTFHGYVADHQDVEKILSAASVAVAPYRASADSFTRYADPGKLKAYVAAGLPIVLTDVPPNARELEAEAGALIVADDAGAVAAGMSKMLESTDEWRARREAALAYARRFDWETLLGDVLAKLERSPITKPTT